MDGDVLVVVLVVEDLFERGAEGVVVGGFEGSQNDRLKNVVDVSVSMYLKARRILPTLPNWVLISFLELQSHVMRRPISRARRTVCMRL